MSAGDLGLAPLQWRSGRVASNGIEIYYEEAGPAQGDPVLLVTGLSWQLIHWPDAFCQELVSRGLRVIRFDNRDSGLSTELPRKVRFHVVKSQYRRKFGLPVEADYTLWDLAKDTVGLMDGLGLRRAHLVGLSMGGMISQILAGTAPERVASLTSIMSTTNHPWLPGPAWPVARFMFFVKPKDQSRDTMVERSVLFNQLIGSPLYPTPEEDIRRLAGLAYDRAFRPGGVLRQTHAIIATGSFEPVLRNVKAPTQIIHGSADRLVRPSGGKRSAKCIPGARLELIEGFGHDLPAALLPRLAGLVTANIARS